MVRVSPERQVGQADIERQGSTDAGCHERRLKGLDQDVDIRPSVARDGAGGTQYASFRFPSGGVGDAGGVPEPAPLGQAVRDLIEPLQGGGNAVGPDARRVHNLEATRHTRVADSPDGHRAMQEVIVRPLQRSTRASRSKAAHWKSLFRRAGMHGIGTSYLREAGRSAQPAHEIPLASHPADHALRDLTCLAGLLHLCQEGVGHRRPRGEHVARSRCLAAHACVDDIVAGLAAHEHSLTREFLEDFRYKPALLQV